MHEWTHTERVGEIFTVRAIDCAAPGEELTPVIEVEPARLYDELLESGEILDACAAEILRLAPFEERVKELERREADVRFIKRFKETQMERGTWTEADEERLKLLESDDPRLAALGAENGRLRTEFKELREAAALVLGGFESGIFIRDISGDSESRWTLKLVDPMRGLAMLANIAEHAKQDGLDEKGGVNERDHAT